MVAVGLLLGIPIQATRGLYRPDEGRYVAVALRMLDTGDWLHPQLHHEAPHWTKPPLTYWALAASMGTFGHNVFAARLPNALALLLTLLLVWVAARRLDPSRAWLAPVVYALFALPRLASNIVTTDTLLALFTTATLAGFVAWRLDARRPRRLLLLMWAGVGLGFLTKGPPALLPLAAILLFSVWHDGPRALLRLRWGLGLAVFLPVGLGWYAAVVLQQPQLFDTFLRREVSDRLFSGAHHRNADPLHILDVYLPPLLLGTFPFTWQVLRGVGRAWGEARRERRTEARLLLCALLLPVAVFCVAPSRLPLYLLQVFAPLAWLAARAAPAGFLGGRRTPVGVALLIGLGSAALVAARWLPCEDDTRPLAERIAAEVPFAPREVVFLRKPHRALALYLDCEVESLDVPGESDPLHGLSEELAEPEARRLFCIEEEHVAGFLAASERRGLPMRALGASGRLRLFAAGSDLPPP